eukprot:TRINITY_DN9893_c0_g1_i2.p1 TRINITY_DN9893_c0_g1~~TRINITY_DN9893_c0_g1_i2.p1  ORF type:complete len:292 (-),score=83.11 TRINITY_DN9893_c0_g1_i2:124-999(-)
MTKSPWSVLPLKVGLCLPPLISPSLLYFTMAARFPGSLNAVHRTRASLQPQWWVVDVRGQRVGRAAEQIAKLLTGKHKPTFNGNTDQGDFVIVVNSQHIEFSGKKWQQKFYRWHTQWPGALKERKAKEMHKHDNTKIIAAAVSGMLPKNKLRAVREKRLKVFAENDHTHQAQNPKFYALKRTKGTDLHAPWSAGIPQHTVNFKYVKQEDGTENWVMETNQAILSNKEKDAMQVKKRAGLLGASNSRTPHPDGYVRGGHRRHGIRYYSTSTTPSSPSPSLPVFSLPSLRAEE